MKNKETLILHDYFDNFGGGERLVNILGDELNSNIVTGFINSQYKHLLNNNIINLNIFLMITSANKLVAICNARSVF